MRPRNCNDVRVIGAWEIDGTHSPTSASKAERAAEAAQQQLREALNLRLSFYSR